MSSTAADIDTANVRKGDRVSIIMGDHVASYPVMRDGVRNGYVLLGTETAEGYIDGRIAIKADRVIGVEVR
jgi:hypothetical protein